jgi:hypothetical protein
MRETRLMGRVDKLPIRCPAVAVQDAGGVGAEPARRLDKAAPVLDRVGRRVRRGKRPQPVWMAADFPPGVIGRDDRAAADGGAERVVGRLRLARCPMHRMDEATARHREIPGSSTRENRLRASVPPCVVIGRRADQRRADPLNECGGGWWMVGSGWWVVATTHPPPPTTHPQNRHVGPPEANSRELGPRVE